MTTVSGCAFIASADRALLALGVSIERVLGRIPGPRIG